MPVSRDYIPTKDADLDAWAINFSAVIASGYASYGLSSGQATAFDTLADAYTAALAAAVNPGTRTPVTVAAKDTARNAVVASARQLGQIARRYPGITDELLSDAGLTVPDPVPSPIPAPTTSPVLTVFENQSLSMVLRMKDSVLTNPRARPDGVTGLQLFTKIGSTPPADTGDCIFQGVFTRVPAVINFDGGDVNKAVYFIGRWMNGKGQVGPISNILTATINA